MSALTAKIRIAHAVPNHVNPQQATNSIPAGTELDAYIDTNGIAWAPYEGETYAVFPQEYEPATPAHYVE